MDHPAVLVAVGSLVTVVVGATVAGIVKLSRNRFTQKRTEKKDTVEELWKYAEELRRDIDFHKQERAADKEESDTRIRELEAEHAECQRLQFRAVAWIEAAQDAMNNAGIKFRPWSQTPAPGSEAHQPLKAKGNTNADA